MARYTNLFALEKPFVPQLKKTLADTLTGCGLNLVYESPDYLVAKEKPGHVSHIKLATVEVLINPPTKTKPTTLINLVVRNEELPLNNNNHCHQVFEEVNQAIAATSA